MINKKAGALVPLFSVYSKNSLGIGEFADLRLLIDWCGKTGNSILQLLPLNEVGSTFCPYDSVSSFALEPSYLCLSLITPRRNQNLRDKIEKIKKKFPCGKGHIDYAIKEEKIKILWDVFSAEINFGSAQFKQFIDENKYWIPDFALYKVLKSYHEGRPWYEWQEQYKNRQPQALENFSRVHEREILFEIWVQWQLYEQLKAVRKYAQEKNILLKGDLPIFVSRDSADVWVHPEFFKLEFAAGAPPDMYAALGQRWGMPTYNWENIAVEGYRYLKEKLKFADNFYDLLRIDHVVGLFRIWSIPYGEPLENAGINGFFDPADEKKWKEHGEKLLSVLKNSTRVLLCAEDLGVIPRICPKTLKDMRIPGNDVQRWVKDWKVKHDFLAPEEYRSLSVAMLSTHDTTNWPAWWENEAGTVDEALFQRRCAERHIDYNSVKDKLFNKNLSRHGRLRWKEKVDSVDILVNTLGKRKKEVLDFIDLYENSYREKEKLWKHLKLKGRMRERADREIIEAVLKITLDSKAVFCINLITDWLYLADIFRGDPYQYRINTPGTISRNNWSLVIPIALEDLLKHKVCGKIKQMVAASGRI